VEGFGARRSKARQAAFAVLVALIFAVPIALAVAGVVARLLRKGG
jgi:hypothetical protein